MENLQLALRSTLKHLRWLKTRSKALIQLIESQWQRLIRASTLLHPKQSLIALDKPRWGSALLNYSITITPNNNETDPVILVSLVITPTARTLFAEKHFLQRMSWSLVAGAESLKSLNIAQAASVITWRPPQGVLSKFPSQRLLSCPRQLSNSPSATDTELQRYINLRKTTNAELVEI